MADLVDQLDWLSRTMDENGHAPNETWDLANQAKAEISRLRSQLAVAEVREAVMRGALADFKQTAAKEIIFNGAGCSREYVDAERRAKSALATPSPIADAMVAVVEAASEFVTKATRMVTGYESVKLQQTLLDALKSLDEARSK